MNSRIQPEALSVAETAIECRRSAATIRRWMRDGQLESIVLPSGRRLVPIEALTKMQRIPATPARGRDRSSARSAT